MKEHYHIPVLLNESIEGLAIKPEGIYVDATYGGGGHSSAILQKLTSGKLIAFDQDEDVRENLIKDERLIFVQHNFKYIRNFLQYYNIEKVDGILADLGVSSHDFDVAERGFSFRSEGRLDMRMNRSSGFSAYELINNYDSDQLARFFYEYGEVNNSRRIAGEIVKARASGPIVSTTQLTGMLEPLVPKKNASKFLAQLFQAIRIEVNQEMDALKSFLSDSARILNPGGRLVVISYHSLEDRLVKNLIQKGNFEGKIQQDFYGNISVLFRQTGQKIIVPSEEEIRRNPRARSAKLRIAEKI
jgi:16S rRNA (cytosine1402-N4)-methyltransferase